MTLPTPIGMGVTVHIYVVIVDKNATEYKQNKKNNIHVKER